MKIVDSSIELLKQEGWDIKGIYQQIEKCARICYLSLDKMTDNSWQEFTKRMIGSGHFATLEHGSVYMKTTQSQLFDFYKSDPYSKVYVEQINGETIYYITTNYRVIEENKRWHDLTYCCEPTDYHHKRICIKFILPISISREFCRHRKFSFCEQSTRYVNFSKEFRGKEITFIKPYWYNEETSEEFKNNCQQAEDTYMHLTIKNNLKAQEAREFLPLCTKTELVMTGFVQDWNHFISLRAHHAAHPDAQKLAVLVKELLIEGGYING